MEIFLVDAMKSFFTEIGKNILTNILEILLILPIMDGGSMICMTKEICITLEKDF